MPTSPQSKMKCPGRQKYVWLGGDSGHSYTYDFCKLTSFGVKKKIRGMRTVQEWTIKIVTWAHFSFERLMSELQHPCKRVWEEGEGREEGMSKIFLMLGSSGRLSPGGVHLAPVGPSPGGRCNFDFDVEVLKALMKACSPTGFS
jgi:hypothetical protein